MQRFYDFTAEQISMGKTVMFYDTRTNKAKLCVNDMARVHMSCGVMFVDGISVKGMTMAVKK